MKKRKLKIIPSFIALMVVLYTAYGDKIELLANNFTKAGTETVEKATLKMHILDVGQGDSIFIELPNNQTMLIDAGEREYSDKVISYINSTNTKTIDYVIGTHPHSDHIGALSKVVDAFTVNNIYLPKVSNNTKTYENLLNSIKNQNLKIKKSKAGVEVYNDDDLSINFLAPNSDEYKDLNNYSIVTYIKYKDTTYLLMGDAETLSEKEIKGNIKADVIKVGHHGSNSSSSEKFIKRVNPTYAIISVGEGNSYNLPKNEIIKRYEDVGAKIYRTDEVGTIDIISDGKNINIKTEK